MEDNAHMDLRTMDCAPIGESRNQLYNNFVFEFAAFLISGHGFIVHSRDIFTPHHQEEIRTT